MPTAMGVTRTTVKAISLRNYGQHRFKRAMASQAQFIAQDQDHKVTRPFNEIPGPSYLEVLATFMPGGKLHDASLTDYAQAMRKKYGDIFLIPSIFGRKPMLQTFATEDFETIFRNEGPTPIKESLDTVKHFRTEVRKDLFEDVSGLMVAQGEPWSKLRSTVNPVLMKPNIMTQYIKPLLQANKEFVDRIAEIRDPVTKEVPATFENDMNRMILETVAIVALNKEIGFVRENRNDPVALKLLDNAFDFFIHVYKLDMEPSIWKIFPTPTYKEMIRVQTELFETTKSYVIESLQAIKQKKLAGEGNDTQSVIEKLVEINPKTAIVTAMEVLLNGINGISATLSSILLALAKNPEKQKKLREEILKILPTKDSKLTEENMKSMPYLRAVIKESLRFYPNGPGSFRTTSTDLTLSGYQIPAGTKILLNYNMLTLDEEFYPKPQEFLPERWLRGSNIKKGNPFTFLPFGFGARMCVGRRIVELDVEMMVASLIRNYYIEYNHPVVNPFRTYFIVIPDFPFTFTFKDVEY